MTWEDKHILSFRWSTSQVDGATSHRQRVGSLHARQNRQPATRVFQRPGIRHARKSLGILVRHTPHDAEAILRFTRIERAFAEHLCSPDWEPHVPTFRQAFSPASSPKRAGCYGPSSTATNTTSPASNSRCQRSGNALLRSLAWSRVDARRHRKEAILSFPIEGSGFGAVLATEKVQAPASLKHCWHHGRAFQASSSSLLARMDVLCRKPWSRSLRQTGAIRRRPA